MYTKIYGELIFPSIEYLYKTDIQRRLEYLKKTQWWDGTRLEKLQNKRLKALIQHAYDNVPYYRRVFREMKISPSDIKSTEDLSKLPLLTKDTIRKNFDDLLARNLPKGAFVKRHSSGSTGEPMRYFIDKATYSDGWAQTFRCWSWAGYNLGEPYVKISLNPRTSSFKRVQDILMNCTYIYASDINKETIENKVKQIVNSGAKIIRGYSSSLYLMSKYIERREINLEGIDAVMTTGDMLFPEYRKLIESQFNCPVFDAYGGENITVSFECEKHEGYHLCDEQVIVEFLKNGEAVDYGELGEIVLTSLTNYAMPFIRYRINDLGRPKEGGCSCGRGLGLMESVEGRDTDIIVTPKGDYVVVHFFTILFEYMEGVNRFQVIQDKIDHLQIKIIKNDRFKDSDLEYIKSNIRKEMGDEVELDINFVDSIPATKSGKRRFVISKVSPRIFQNE